MMDAANNIALRVRLAEFNGNETNSGCDEFALGEVEDLVVKRP